ncbi:hypothetical protein [Actinacidiphila alni]|uniref:hypothetical protein n=1 Tax=Actinacidiphila alni TaxID=380248 RepID=UPI0011604992|nr:hypothetical protein [Actinacidiphila alni]
MTTEPAGAAAEFAFYFRSMVVALGDHAGWYRVFTEREPGAARAYEDGTDVPPWDVVSAVLHDLAAAAGAPLDDAEAGRARTLHRAAVADQDSAPGAENALRNRLDATSRARETALLREREATRALDRTGADPANPAVARLANILAWARDDRERAAARCDEIRARLAAFTAPSADEWFRQPPQFAGEGAGGAVPRVPAPRPRMDDAGTGAARPARSASWAREDADTGDGAEDAAASRSGRGRGFARLRGARFAGVFQETAAAPEPGLPADAGPAPRGARFAGAPERGRPSVPELPLDPGRRAQARQDAARLGDLRRTGQSGAAYVFLSEAANGPAAALPYLVRELERSELAADVATLLWEVATLPADPLAAAATELAAAGRADDCRTLLHQAASRPPADLAMIAGALTAAGCHEEVAELLGALVRVRPPEEAVAVVKARPGLAQPLLAAAEAVSRSRQRDIAAALRRSSLPDR